MGDNLILTEFYPYNDVSLVLFTILGFPSNARWDPAAHGRIAPRSDPAYNKRSC